ncbi:DsbA family protein [Halegenticoccus soli]|uniref:DsbA family protein n=1 Tax=Halegenticoccus soli TaxID=1985678 RepID=UPI000C6E32AD|nr:thioredoxin domain-containing protein [Halegenticoccus soli]
MKRRTFLSAATASALPLAGCAGSANPLGGGESHSTEPLASNPAAANIDDNPTLGPDPAEAEAVIVAFEDPSCPSCRRFASNAFPKIESNLVEEGRAAFVHRSFPHVREWATAAAHALASTAARSEAAFWGLNSRFYERQDAITTDNVFDEVRSFLESESSIDAEGVVSDARERVHERAVREDLDAVEGASVGGTPTFFLFEGGEFVTTITGSENYRVFENALE